MNSEKIRRFMKLAGQEIASDLCTADPEKRRLGARLLLSEVLEYVIHGLGVEPEVEGVRIRKPDAVEYVSTAEPDPLQMLDGLADVAYTMYWNAEAFGVPLDQAFELVCDNNLDKFVQLKDWQRPCGALPREEWNLELGVEWPPEVATVEVIEVQGEHYAVGKDASRKVCKPSTYSSVDLSALI